MNSVFHLKEKFEKSSTRNDGCRRQDINDRVFFTRKTRNHQQQKE